MENYFRLKDWIVSHHKDIQLELKKLSWPSCFSLPLYDYEAMINIDGEYYIGRGTSENEETAIITSIVESIERAVCFENIVLFSGVAAHLAKEIAKEKAIFESVERFYYLRNIEINGIGDLQDLCPDLKSYTKKFEQKGASLEFRNLSNGQFKGSICYASFKDKTLIGLGLKESVQDSQKKALFECLTNLSHYMVTGQIKENSHQRIKVSFDRKKFQFAQRQAGEVPAQSISHEFFPKSEILKSIPLFFFGANSTECQYSDTYWKNEASL